MSNNQPHLTSGWVLIKLRAEHALGCLGNRAIACQNSGIRDKLDQTKTIFSLHRVCSVIIHVHVAHANSDVIQVLLPHASRLDDTGMLAIILWLLECFKAEFTTWCLLRSLLSSFLLRAFFIVSIRFGLHVPLARWFLSQSELSSRLDHLLPVFIL